MKAFRVCLALLVCVALVLLSAACGSSEPSESTKKRTKEATAAEANKDTEKQTKQETEDTARKENETSAATEAPTLPPDVPQAVVDPALVGTWVNRWMAADGEVETIWIFNADGTGTMLGANGYEYNILSYVATTTPYTQYPEDGFLLTVYWAEITEVVGGETITIDLDPVEYGYQIDGDTLRITYSRDIANDYVDFKRE